jgi:4-alpha-glucanotransferase
MSARTPANFARRRSGVLLHLTSLPGPHGIGDLGDAATEFADWCARAGHTIWQMLPVGPVGPGNSPYASTSSFAGEPLLVSLDRLTDDGLLPRIPPRRPAGRVDYERARALKMPLLLRAFERWHGRGGHRSAAFRTWQRAQAAWLPAWCQFASTQRSAVNDLGFHAFVQWKFDAQWRQLQAHCARRQVLLLGDVPIFVPLNSADVRQNPKLFRLDRHGRPTVVTGVPPDCFSTTGQRWGHPHYRWTEHRRTRFAWWIARVQHALQRFDALRIDHFVGFVHAYEIPGAAATARRGAWRPAPGAELLQALERACGALPLVAEDLGAVTPPVTALRERFGLPGMKLVQNAFSGPGSGDLPSLHPHACVAYAGTHDNNTVAGWWRTLPRAPRSRFTAYAGPAQGESVSAAMIRAVLQSPARTAVIAMQDHLNLGSGARMNTPGKPRGQWEWQMTRDALRSADAASIRRLAEACART